MSRVWQFFALILIAAKFFMPKTGPTALLDELCIPLLLLLISVWSVCRLMRRKQEIKNTGKAILVVAAVIGLSAAVWLGSRIVRDLAAGPETVRLTGLQVTHAQGHSGVFFSHYYLTGTDPSGNVFRAEISGRDYSDLSGARSAVVTYYRRTERILNISQKG